MRIQFQTVTRIDEFSQDLKKLKRFKSLTTDLTNFINIQLYSYHKLGQDNYGLVRIPNLGFEYPPIYKAKKFTCRALKGKGARSCIRVIYAYFKEMDKVELIEIYYKSKDDTKENKERIMRNYSDSAFPLLTANVSTE